MNNTAARICAGALALCLLLALSACDGSEQDSASTPPAAEEPVSTAATAEPAGPAEGGTIPALMLLGGTCTQEGCYILRGSPDGRSNILYADYASGKMLYLCARPECTHTDDTCTSFCICSPNLFAANGKLYQFCANPLLENHPVHLDVCGADGANRRELFRESPQGGISDRMVADSGSLYYLESVYGSEMDHSDETGHLWRVDLETGKKELVSEHNYSLSTLVGSLGGELLVQQTLLDEPSIVLSAVDKETGEAREICRFASGEELAGVCGGEAVFYLADDAALRAVDLVSGDARTVPLDASAIDAAYAQYAPGAPESQAYTAYNALLDGKVFLEVCEGEDPTLIRSLYSVDITSGKMARTGLHYPDGEEAPGEPVRILGETQNDFLVIHDFAEDALPVSEDIPEAPFGLTSMTYDVYGLISKEDFYASRPNYRDFALT